MARRARRTFTPEFEATVVLHVLTGSATQAEVCRKHRISPSLFALWKATLLTASRWSPGPTSSTPLRPPGWPTWSGRSASRPWSGPP